MQSAVDFEGLSPRRFSTSLRRKKTTSRQHCLGDHEITMVRKKMRSALFAALMLGTCGSAPPARAQANENIEVLRIRPSFYVIAGAGGNIGVQIGTDGVVLVDAGAKGDSGQVLAEIRKLTDQPIRYIINTSADADHVGGNADLAKAGRSIFLVGGAAGVMRLPERLHITWQDDTTLRIDIDAGVQTRLFHFGDWKAPATMPSWQGDSLAQWERAGSLKVATTHLRGGYLRKNGVPYSDNTNLMEHYDVVSERNGEIWLIVTTTVRDPRYLRQPYITAAQFKKEPDATRWDPTPCSARW